MGVIEARRRILLSAPHVEATTPAGVANFQTDLISPLKSLKAGFLPVQNGSGDPSPSNVRPISGWSGLTVKHLGKNLINVPDTTTSGYIFNLSNLKIPAGTYTLSMDFTTDVTPSIAVSGPDGDYINTSKQLPYTFTVSGVITGIRCYVSVQQTYSNIQLELGSTPTPYSPYTGTTIPVTFPAAGKNLFDEANAQGYAKYINMTTPPEWKNSSDSLSYVMKAQPNTTYSANANNPNITIFKVGILDKSPDTVGNTAELVRAYQPVGYQTFTTPNEECWIVLQYNKAIAEARTGQIQVELGSTATSYEPYRNAYYGGYVDLVRGEVVAEWGVIAKTWGDFGNKTVLGDNTRGLLSIASQPSAGTGLGAMCNVAPRDISWSVDTVHFYTNEGSCIVILPNSTSQSTDIQIVYPIATPIHYPLTPQIIKSLRGTNNIWSDANGNIQVSYWSH